MRSPTTAVLAVAAGLAAIPALAAAPLAGASPAPCTVHDTTTGHVATYTGTGALQAAVAGATAGDTLAASGTCTGATDVTKDVSISGTATLDGAGTAGSVVTIAHGVGATLTGLDITGGSGNYDVNGIAPLDFGGGIDDEGHVSLEDVTVTKNTAGNGGGIFVDIGASLALGGHDGTSITANTADGSGGGGIYLYKGSVIATSAAVSHNTAVGPGVLGGGGIFNNGGRLVLGTRTTHGTSVSWNTAPNGAGIDNYGAGARLAITNGQINRNTAVYIGGGIKNWPGNVVALTDTGVDWNRARIGAGLYSAGSLTLRAVAVNDNTAGAAGGGIFNDTGGSLTALDTTVHANHAGNVGGGIASNGPASLTGDAITGNVSTTGGGGIYSYHSQLVLARTGVSRDTAPRGGGIYAWGVGRVTLRGSSTITRNTATVHDGGGGIFYFGGTKLVGVKAGHNVRLNTHGNVVA